MTEEDDDGGEGDEEKYSRAVVGTPSEKGPRGSGEAAAPNIGAGEARRDAAVG